jgi:arylsulfatase A-like enzyme
MNCKVVCKLLSLALCGALGGTFAVPTFAESPPNVVIFLADDAGWGDYSRNGNTQISTPNIDSIAADGVTLDRFYVCPVCAPTRAEFLTGRYHPRTGVYGVSTGQERMNLDEKTIADAFKSAGYATGAFGKWHNGSQWPYHPMARGFDEYTGYTSGHWGEYFDPPLEQNGKPIREKGYIVDVLTTHAIDFIDRHHEKPFFCYVPFTTPHSPWAVPEEDWKRFESKPITLSASQPKQEDIQHTRCALAMVENQDRNVGRVLKKLNDLNVADNTIVLYFSDNGPNSWRFNGGMKGRKGMTDEGGVRSTCFLRWTKGLPAGAKMESISGAIDLLPTLTSLARIDRVGDKPLDGMNLTPLLRGEVNTLPERTIFSTWSGKVSARTQTHRIDDAGNLFDMVADPGQTHELDAKESEIGTSLLKQVAHWREEVLGGKTRGEKQKGGKSVDPRSIPVGYREFPRTWLPARDGEPIGSVKRSANAPNSSYFVNWTSADDRLVWNLDVNTAGRYQVEVQYTCPLADAGSVVELSYLNATLSGKVTPGWDPPVYTNQDTLPRPPGESQMKEFRTLVLGTVELAEGEGELQMRATEIPGKEVMDLRALTLTLLD